MTEAPHLFWGYQEDVVLNCKSHFILPGDMLVFFSGSIILDEFCLHANKVIDVFGIDHSVVRFDGGEGKLMFVFHGAATFLDEDEVRSLLIKVYQQNERGQWLSAIPDYEKPWEGWCQVNQLKVCHNTGKGSVILDETVNKNAAQKWYSEMRDSAETFLVEDFKPAYQRFVRKMRKWNAKYVNSLGLGNQSMRQSIENECNQFNVNRFRYGRPDLLARIASFIGIDQYGNHFMVDQVRLVILTILGCSAHCSHAPVDPHERAVGLTNELSDKRLVGLKENHD